VAAVIDMNTADVKAGCVTADVVLLSDYGHAYAGFRQFECGCLSGRSGAEKRYVRHGLNTSKLLRLSVVQVGQKRPMLV